MGHSRRTALTRQAMALCVLCVFVPLWLTGDTIRAQQWPQWRGPARDGVAQATAPAAWPAALTKKWKIPAGSGYSTPIVVDARVFVHARTGDQEVVSAHDVDTGREIWRDAYPAPYRVNQAAAAHGPGPKSSPAHAQGRVYTYGISGILSCYDAASGKVVWRKQPSPEQPIYGVATSPVVVDGVVWTFVGGTAKGALIGLDAINGAVRWQWTGGAPAYASPVVATLAGVKQLVTQSRTHVVGVGLDGKLLWQIPLESPYDQNSVTPIVVGDLVVFSALSNPTVAGGADNRGGDRACRRSRPRKPAHPLRRECARRGAAGGLFNQSRHLMSAVPVGGAGRHLPVAGRANLRRISAPRSDNPGSVAPATPFIPPIVSRNGLEATVGRRPGTNNGCLAATQLRTAGCRSGNAGAGR